MSAAQVATEPPPLTAADLEADRFLVEKLVGRPLRLAEQAIDVLGLNDALERAKDELERAIRAEQRRAIRRALDTHTMVRIELTRPMLDVLERLFRLGAREGLAELRRLGYKPKRALAAVPEHPELHGHARTLRSRLNALSMRVDDDLVTADIGELGRDAVARTLLQVPGARDVASRMISGALTSGLAVTFDQNQELIGGWEYTSVLDGGTCDPCASLDGAIYPSWDAIMEVLPDGGPNPDCDGGDRCRCRPVPAGAA